MSVPFLPDRILCRVVFSALATLLAGPWIADAEEPRTSPGKSLPTLAAGESDSVRLQGEIRHSTRGKGKGAVRLDVVSDAGEKVAVLTVSDDTLDAHGLSLRPGERIDARGSLLPGKVPLLVAVEVVVDGRTIQLREMPKDAKAEEGTGPEVGGASSGQTP